MKKIAVIFVATGLLLAGAGFALYYANREPVASAISTEEASNPNKPFVVKLHAQWCALCMFTKSAWSQIEKAAIDAALKASQPVQQ